MHLVVVDVIQSECPQAVLDSTAKPGSARIAGKAVLRHPQAALGRDHDLVTTVVKIISQGLTKVPLRRSESVSLSSVEEVDAELTAAPNCSDSLLLVKRTPLTT